MSWVVIGASAGLGRALCESLGRRRMPLLLVARDERDLLPLAADLRIRFGVEARVLAFDAADHAGLAERLFRELGDAQIDGLLFPLGIVDARDDGTMPADQAELLVRVNFLSVVSVVGRLLPGMLHKRRGVIVGFGSVAAVRGRSRNVVYAACKRALESYFESLRHLCEPRGVTVMFYTLGYMDTTLAFGRNLVLPKANPHALAEQICVRLGRESGRRHLPAFWGVLTPVIRRVPWSVFKRLRF